MIPYVWHPTSDRLNRYADGELGDSERRRVATHLADCSDCRRTIARIRELGDRARSMPVPTPPDDALAGILARRAAGDRVLLPTQDPGIPRRTRPFAVAVAGAAAIAAFFLVTFAVWAPTAQADRTRLQITPEAPAAGATLGFAYDGDVRFPEADRLVLRARYHYRDGTDRIATVGQLVRGEDDVFRARYPLPAEAVYGVFAVEDLAARTVDSNSRRFWEVLVHRDGRPSFDALSAKVDEHLRRDPAAAYDVAVTLSEDYPDRVLSWLRRFSFEKSATDEGMSDVIDRHWKEFRQLDAELRESAEPPQVALMARYAHELDHPTAEYWLDRARKVAPHHEATILTELARASRAHAGEPGLLLDTFETLWSAAASGRHVIASQALAYAQALEDAKLIQRWSGRYDATSNLARIRKATILVEYPELRSEGIRLLQSEIRRLRALNDEDRALYASVSEQMADNQRPVQMALAELGSALLAEGRRAEALQALRECATTEWQAGALARCGELLIQVGAESDAVRAVARLMALPIGDAARRADLRARLSSTPPDIWDDALVEARVELRQDMMARSVVRFVDLDVTVRDANGVPHALGSLVSDDVTVVAIWSSASPRVRTDLERMERLARELRDFGIELIAIDVASADDATPFSVDPPLSRSAFVDERRRARATFTAAGTQDYFILDRQGRIRFEHLEADAVLLRARVLQSVTGAAQMIAADEREDAPVT